MAVNIYNNFQRKSIFKICFDQNKLSFTLLFIRFLKFNSIHLIISII